ncbi:TonB-dependent receptor [Brevundimonas sp. 2P06AA]|uniref:TonB-dependent receptor domain-containing protein n=1 Tax=Brevundimonas sp. 2P06AA TaxID=3132273 RepID=UPI0039A1713E
MSLKRKYLFGTTVLAGVVAVAAPAMAQTQTPPVSEESTQVEEIVVTGSRIRRDPTTVAAPIIQIDGAALLETGMPTVIDYLATIPALSNSLVPSDTTGSGLNDGGLEFANLRSLGSGRTLTLIDGRRHVGSSAGVLSVDVSTIPRLLIQNIEIITGGASSVYGADAVSGVVNYTLRKDYEGLEVDANYGQLVKGGDAVTRRVSALGGINLFDDRLNVYAHAEWEKADELRSNQIGWLRRGRVGLGIDADPTNLAIGPAADGFIDTGEFFNARRLDRPLWGTTTLANMQRPSPFGDPDVPVAACRSFSTSSNCFNVDPAYTYWFDGATARLADFGQRIGSTGANRPWNIGGDGELANMTAFDAWTRFPEQESQRYQVGANLQVSDNIRATFEAKYTTEDAFDQGQFSFWDIFIVDSALACGGTPFGGAARSCNNGNAPGLIGGTSSFATRTDNAFLPANLVTAIRNNTFIPYSDPTNTTPGAPGTAVTAPIALHRGFGIPRDQTNNREVQRYVAAFEGDYDRIGFINNANWSLSYTYGEMNNKNRETGPDAIRFGHAMDSIVDTAGIVNGKPGEIVCRVQHLAARGIAVQEQNPNTTTTSYTDAATNPEIAGCKPLNVFGMGNQSAEALEYISASVTVNEKNVQESAVATFGGQVGDFWGAGQIGFSVGAEYRREYTEGVGRSRDTNNRLLQLNTGADFLGVEYETTEFFAELAIPLFRDSWLGEYAEFNGSYRTFDYTTAGTGDVYGLSLVYRPIQDIMFKTSFNTSFRAPNLSENYRPYGQTFVNSFSDPCDTRVIASLSGNNAAEIRTNRIANCTALAAQKGLAYDFGQATVGIGDDYRPAYSAGVASVLAGNPDLRPKTSESFTFSTILRPRFIPNFSLVLDYYEITIDDVIVTPSGQQIANQCVNGAQLDAVACALIRRENPNNDADPFNVFKVGAPVGDPIGGFILQTLNFAKLETRGLDVTATYSLDTEEVFGKNFGRFNYSFGALWLIEQKQYTSLTNRDFFDDLTTNVFYPRLEGTSRLSWTSPNNKLSVSWLADWMASQDLVKKRDAIASGNVDQSPTDWWTTGNFVRHDVSFNYKVTDDVTVRAGVTNLTDVEPPLYLGFASTFDPYGRRFFVGLNYKLF